MLFFKNFFQFSKDTLSNKINSQNHCHSWKLVENKEEVRDEFGFLAIKQKCVNCEIIRFISLK